VKSKILVRGGSDRTWSVSVGGQAGRQGSCHSPGRVLTGRLAQGVVEEGSLRDLWFVGCIPRLDFLRPHARVLAPALHQFLSRYRP
jgi:hypothetical protein